MTKEARIHNGEKTVSSISGAGKTGQLHVKIINLDTNLTPFTKINLKWITVLNIKCETIKLLEDNIGENLNDLGYGDDFFKIQH